MTEYIFEKHPKSLRTCILEDRAGTLWLYLTAPDTLQPIADVWVANSIRDDQETDPIPPPAPEAVVTPGNATPIDGMDYAWTIQWNDAGDEVVLHKNAVPHAAITASQKRGRNRTITRECPWGNPWI